MGNSPPKTPPKTTKELQREMNRAIDRMIREFGRDKFRLNADISKAERDLQTSIKKKEPRASQRILAQNIIKNRAFMQKFDLLEARMKAMKLQVAQVSTTEAMVSIMKGMGEIVGRTSENLNVNNIQAVIENFNMKMEESAGMQEVIDDAMADDEVDTNDADVDKYIDTVADKMGGGKGDGGMKVTDAAKVEGSFDNMLNDLKK